jgi:hypothetical protein
LFKVKRITKAILKLFISMKLNDSLENINLKYFYSFRTLVISKLHVCLLQPGFQIAVVQGGIDCGDRDYPGIFVSLYDPPVLNYIKSFVVDGSKAEGKRIVQVKTTFEIVAFH